MNIRKWLCKNFGRWGWLYNLCSCERYEKPSPEPKYVNRLVCVDTGFLSNVHCPTVEISRFIEGKEPLIKCTLHKKPAPPPSPVVYPDPIPILGFQGVGGFNYFKLTGNTVETLKLLKEIKMHGYYLNDGFMFLSDNKPHHKNLTYHTPWLWVGDGFDLNEWNLEFWDDFKMYLEMHKEVGLDFCPQLWMRKDYSNYPFKKNVNFVTDFWGRKSQQVGFLDEDVVLIHRTYARKVMDTFKEVYGNQYKPYVKIMNEAAHYGDYEHAHRIMYFHEDIVESVLLGYTDLKHIIVDGTGCEMSIGELKHKHKCPKPVACDRGGRHGKKGYANKVVMERHKFSTWADFFEIQRMVNSPIPEAIYTEDGGGRAEDGDYSVPRTGMKLGSPEQQGWMMRQLALIYQATGFRAIFKSFPHEALKKIDGVFYPDYRVSEMKRTFACAKEMQKAYEEVMK